ncbi:uncharacterized protein LOC115681117 [Syzygium oleosum]|uniref:uncharacterized protein LOC115681117 n=1 Tax=Syzygium oleosum TaxID=219896 RepID=UPI0024BB4BC5|nr:uncharacterized protein LOC115681117 [Syzygium oleosum]
MVSPQIHLSKWLVLIISIIGMTSDGHARARILISNQVTGFNKPKGTVKTIESHETGEVIDCVDIFKQPAFDHPLLKNHTIQMKPNSNQKANGEKYVEGAFRQVWWKYGECPEGTVPIKRRQNLTNHHVRPLTPRLHQLNLSRNDINGVGKHEYAAVSMRGGNYNGAYAKINVWNPTVMENEGTFSQIWVAAGPDWDVNTVEAGWMINRERSNTNEAQIFTFWTGNGYRGSGCYDVDCEGFVHINRQFALGAVIRPVSVYGGDQYDVPIRITRVLDTGSWWLHVANIAVAYWPPELFSYLKGPATRIDWGGEIVDMQQRGSHTSTQMGSGHFPYEGLGHASYFSNLKFIDEGLIERDPENLLKIVHRSECYDLMLNKFGVDFYYGGPGFSPQCTNF